LIEVPEVRAVLQALISLLCVLAATIALIVADDASMRAQARERSGYYRGSFIDRAGKLLVYTSTRGREPRQVSTLPSLSLLTGYRDPQGAWHGLERRFQALLTARRARQDWRTFFLRLRGQAPRGGSVKLTIDSRLQRVAEKALGSARGAIVAIDPSTGGVLAMVSNPYCSPTELASAASPERCRRDQSNPLLNRAVGLALPPGSAFKIVTLTAALDTGTFRLSSVFAGADAFGPSPYFNNLDYPSNVTRADLTQLTLSQALAFSDNFTFAHIGLTLGAPTLLRYAHRFYIGKQIPFDLPVTRSHIAAGNPHPSPAQLAQSSFGAEVDRVTPLQMALVTSAVANRGVLMAPHLVDRLLDAGGHVLHAFAPHSLGRVMSASTAASVTTAMEFVVNHGSGYRAQIAGVRVAGKTGTAASGASLPHAWFISFAPAQHPVIAVAVLHEFAGEGFKYAAPLARQMVVTALQERGFRVR